MSEDMNLEAAYTLSERGAGKPDQHDRDNHQRRKEISELIEIAILAVVAVATAWSVYQAARWEGRQAFLYSESTRLRIEGDEAATLGGQQRLLDVSTFNTWIEADALGQDEIADLYVERFSPEFREAFDAWLALDPLSNPNAPPGPSFMPEYRNDRIELAAALNNRARETFDEGTEARETADRYVRLTVLFATVLFLVAVSQRFTYHVVRLTANGIAAVLMLGALIGLLVLPRL
jgi:hypothetical protein